MTLAINLKPQANRSYAIFIENGVIDQLFQMIHQHLPQQKDKQFYVVSDDTVWQAFGARLTSQAQALGVALNHCLVEPGETSKSLAQFERLHTWLLESKAKRRDVLIALGGGVVGDLAGFVAASYQRGMPFIQVPTTLLAQVDSSVGGKVAVNHALGKNMIGAFYQPLSVFIDPSSLLSLPQREYCAGLAEVVKYGCMRSASFFAWLEENATRLNERDLEAVAYAITESCRFKAEVVAADETEEGERALLNFGHTFAHAIEAGMGYGVWRHGEAVAAGMVAACVLSEDLGLIDAQLTAQVRQLLTALHCPTDMPTSITAQEYWALMQLDKKNSDARMTFIVLEALGKAKVYKGVSFEQTRRALP